MIFDIIFDFSGPWTSHGTNWFQCNKYDDAASKNARDEQEVT